MSAHEVPLPSPPPDTYLRLSMSGLFARARSNNLTSDGLSDPIEAETEYVARKKVDFHPFAQNILNVPQLSTPDSEVPPSLKSLPPSRDCQLSSRPILKQTHSLESTLGFDGQNERKSSLDNMESLLQHLADNDRSSSIDAYQTITSLIKMYDDPPEQEVLQTKMAELQKFIRRDLVVLDVNADALPSNERLSRGNLVMSALKVLVTMVWSPTYSPCLTEEFRVWTIERSIQVLREHTASKATLLHYMHLLATQNFTTKTMAQNNRVPRILEVLQELTDHISGKAVVAERLLIYQKLVDQAKLIMKSKARLWVKNLITAMGHSFKEVRTNAISAGTKACIAFAGQASVAPFAREALAEINNERTLSSSITNRLERVLAAKDEANQIPQIWTIILMLCNTGNQRLDTWPQLHEWLKLIQRCFNCSDSTVRVQAFMAWNRLYYVARPTEATEKIVSMLAKPAMIQLDRTGNNQSGKGTRQAVVSSYCMLLYYAFRPAAQHSQYVQMWNEFVVKVMTRSFLSKSSANCDLSSRIISALFHSALPGSRVWNENRAHENAPLDPLELPAIDCRWIRSKMSSVLSIVGLLVEYSSFGPDGKLSEQSYVAQAWCNLVRALRESTSKEVMASAETKAALTSLLDFLRPALDEENDDISPENDRLRLLARIMITELGSSAVLQALESSTEWRNSILLEQLILNLVEPSDEVEGQLVDRAKLIDRGFTLLGEDIRHLARSDSPTKLLHIINNVLQQIPSSKATQCLIQIQDATAESIGGLKSSCHTTWDTFGFLVVTGLLVHVAPSDYILLDTLLSAVLCTKNHGVQEALLEAWAEMPINELQPCLGPRSLASIAALPQSFAEGNSRLNSGTTSASVLFTILRMANHVSQHQIGKLPSEEAPKPYEKLVTTSKHQNVKTKHRHDDSQVQFVSIASSPPDYENFESQLLTARQKDVRARQRTEPVLTFADIRSSPSTCRKKVQPAISVNDSTNCPETPTTPTLPHQRAHDDEDQQATPTPKTRKSLLSHLQPDVPSSPPSELNKEAVQRLVTTITSSPVKDPTELDGALQLNDVVETDFASANQGLLSEDQEVREWANEHKIPSCARPGSPELPVETISNRLAPLSATEKSNEIDANASTPNSYSDEYDALAASQLSQNLVEQSQNSSVEVEVHETPRSNPKRKRNQIEHGDSGKKRRRRSSIIAHHENQEEPSQQQPAAISLDTIVINMDKVPSKPTPRRGRSGRPHTSDSTLSPSSPAPSQASQKSTAIAPSSVSSRGGRKGRTKRKTRSQASRGESPDTQTPVSAGKLRAELLNGVEDIEQHAVLPYAVMADAHDLSISELPSLASEVAETAEQEVPALPLERDIRRADVAPSPILPQHEKELFKNVQHAAQALSPAPALAEIPTHPITQSQGTSTDFDLALNLQGILEHLNMADSSKLGKEIDLAAIHSLCFKIGLKAQELAMAEQR